MLEVSAVHTLHTEGAQVGDGEAADSALPHLPGYFKPLSGGQGAGGPVHCVQHFRSLVQQLPTVQH